MKASMIGAMEEENKLNRIEDDLEDLGDDELVEIFLRLSLGLEEKRDRDEIISKILDDYKEGYEDPLEKTWRRG